MGLKRHPNIMEDGSLWSESHPYGRFSSHREKLDYIKRYRKPAPRVPKKTCTLCQSEYYETQEERHKQTKKHKHLTESIRKILGSY
eukprot:38102-Eustigmatos_ZCMA.PRE.1